MSSENGRTILLERARRIVEILPQQNLPPDIEARVRGFLRVNGYAPLERAAKEVADRASRPSKPLVPEDPWAYTVQIVNDEQSRGSLLQTLLHWVEAGLRTRLDLTLSEAYDTPDWYLNPENYVEHRALTDGQLGIKWMRGVKWIEDYSGIRPDPDAYGSGEEFLADLTFRDLRSVVEFCYRVQEQNRVDRRFALGLLDVECPLANCSVFPRGDVGCCAPPHRHSTKQRLRSNDPSCAQRIVAPPPGATLPRSKVSPMLRTIIDARNTVDHGNLLSANLYAEAMRDAQHLLTATGFDVRKATARFDRRRMHALHRLLIDYGYEEGIQVVLKLNAAL